MRWHDRVDESAMIGGKCGSVLLGLGRGDSSQAGDTSGLNPGSGPSNRVILLDCHACQPHLLQHAAAKAHITDALLNLRSVVEASKESQETPRGTVVVLRLF